MHRNLRNLFVMVVLLIGVAICSHATAFAQPTKPPLFAVLLGGNEVDATGQANAGDPNGNGSFTAILDGRTLCFGIVVNGIDTPTLLHIHDNVAGQNGPPVVDLTALRPATGNPGDASGCVTISDAVLLGRLRNSPSGFYVNIHNEKFPAGALRGQLF